MNATTTAQALNDAIAGRDHAAAEEAKASADWRRAQNALTAAHRQEQETRYAYVVARNATTKAHKRLEQARTANQQTDTR